MASTTHSASAVEGEGPSADLRGDEMGLGFLLPLFSCEDDAGRLDHEILMLQVAASSPLVSPQCRARVAEAAEAWRAFRRQHSGFGGCFGRSAIREVGRFTETFERLLREVEQDSLRTAAKLPAPAVITPPVVPALLPTLAPRETPPGSGGRWFWVLAILGGAGIFGFHVVKRRGR